MSIAIRLDASALRALIDDDLQFKLELQRAVVAEVIRNFLLKDASRIIKEIAPDTIAKITAQMKEDQTVEELVRKALAEQYTPRSWSTPAKVKPDLADLIRTTVRDAMSAEITQALASLNVADRVSQMQKRLEAQIADHVSQQVDKAVAQKIAAGVEERLQQIRERLG